ncbi:hypothetical protein [Citrobacter portucalensis]|uniref:hypothetical protein n=1 Tax=Citrobacter portucalensis TaxID=1639133 RepID=UPI003896C746
MTKNIAIPSPSSIPAVMRYKKKQIARINPMKLTHRETVTISLLPSHEETILAIILMRLIFVLNIKITFSICRKIIFIAMTYQNRKKKADDISFLFYLEKQSLAKRACRVAVQIPYPAYDPL